MKPAKLLLVAGLAVGSWVPAHAAPSLKNTMAVWGNGGSALGNNDGNDATPGQVDQTGVLAGKTITQIAAGGYHYLALCSDGTLAAWGLNQEGELGSGSGGPRDENLPVLVATDTALAGKTVVKIAACQFDSYALCSDGTLAAWGLNTSGQLGVGNNTNQFKPALVDTADAMAGKTIVDMGGGQYYGVALCSDNSLFTWGIYENGELGNSNATGRVTTPTPVDESGALAGKTIAELSPSDDAVLVRCTDGSIIGWGFNDAGTLGLGDNSNRFSPTLINGSGPLAGKSVVSLKGGGYHYTALCSDHSVFSWGYGDHGQIGNNSPTYFNGTPIDITSQGYLSGRTVSTIAAGFYHSVCVCSDGTLASWGDGVPAGNGGTTQENVPTAVSMTGPLGSNSSIALLRATRGTSLALLGDPLLADTTRPTVAISTPANAAHVMNTSFGAGSITGTALDDVAVASVQIYFSRTRSGNTEYWTGTAWSPTKTWFPVTLGSTGPNVSTSWVWDTNLPAASDLDLGDYRIAARALDTVKYGISAARSFMLVGELNPPHITIANPTAGERIVDTTFAAGSVSGVATDDTAVNTVTAKLYRVINGVKEYWDGSAWGASATTVPLNLSAVDPTSITWSLQTLPPVGQLPPGAYYVQASATDTAGNSAMATRAFTVVLESVKPVVNIVNPLPSVTVLATKVGSATFKGTAMDNVKVMALTARLYRVRGGVKQFWNGSSWGTTSADAPLSISGLKKANASWYLKPFPTRTTLDTGAYTLWVQATDSSGNTGVDSVMFIVLLDLTKPVATVANPLTNAKVLADTFDNTTVHGTATDNDKVGQIKVKFSRSRAGVKYYWTGSAWTTASTLAPIAVTGLGTASATWSLNPAPGLSDLDAGTYSVNVTAIDPSGNASASVTRNFTVTLPAPSLAFTNPSGKGF